MTEYHEKITPELIDQYARKASVERSIAFSAMFREATASVKKIFTVPEVSGAAREH